LFPSELLHGMFNGLYDMEFVTEGAFKRWKDNGTENYGKGNCVVAAKDFFDWLDSADVESDEPGDT